MLLEAFSGGNLTILAYVAIAAIFYFLMLRPQNKKRKEEAKALDNLNQGDRIITSGGIHGRIVSDNGTNFLIDVGANTKIKIEKSAISIEMTKTLQEPKKEK
ncbi:MAG: preprotein translocase subunit YajC [Methanosarcinales archaeon]|nr:preprotein translocase subunit YajC [Methanosarcinales archaeon]